MARHARTPRETLDAARDKVNPLLVSPLRPIGEKLQQVLDEADCAYQAGSLPLAKLAELSAYVMQITGCLPRSFGERFFFDAAMIQAIAADWGGSTVFSGMILPRYGREWAHQSIQMPSEDRERAHLVDLILLPGEDRLEDVDLLDYPWVAHELGHYILFKDDSTFRHSFARSLEKRIRSLTLAAIADRGAARVRAQATLDELTKFWTPSPDHRNWAHELATDLIALWTCGPAYLACFEHTVEQLDRNPFEITQDHPPYAVRLDALVDCAHELRFGEQCGGLVRMRARWEESKWQPTKDNRFLTLADKRLISECRGMALEYCEFLKLTKCTKSNVDSLRRDRRQSSGDNPGVDLLVSAWLTYQDLGESAFNDWERKSVARILTKIKQ